MRTANQERRPYGRIALVLPQSAPPTPYLAAVVSSVASACSAEDLALQLVLDTEPPGDDVLRGLRGSAVDGVIVSTIGAHIPWVEDLLDDRVPTVMLGRHPHRVDVPTVDTDGKAAGIDLVRHLALAGCERIGLIAGPPWRADVAPRQDGYRLGLEELGHLFDDRLVVAGDYTEKSGRDAAIRLLSDHRLDALVAMNDDMALGAMDGAASLDLRVPTDLAVVGFDGAGRDHRGTLTTMRQPFALLAETAVHMLTELAAGRSVEPTIELVRGELIARHSSARTPA